MTIGTGSDVFASNRNPDVSWAQKLHCNLNLPIIGSISAIFSTLNLSAYNTIPSDSVHPSSSPENTFVPYFLHKAATSLSRLPAMAKSSVDQKLSLQRQQLIRLAHDIDPCATNTTDTSAFEQANIAEVRSSPMTGLTS